MYVEHIDGSVCSALEFFRVFQLEYEHASSIAEKSGH